MFVARGGHARVSGRCSRSLWAKVNFLLFDRYVYFESRIRRHTKYEVRITDLVQEDRSTICRFKTPRAPLQSAGECAFLVSEQLGRNERVRNRRTVHGYEYSRRTIRAFMNRTRDQFLSGSGLT